MCAKTNEKNSNQALIIGNFNIKELVNHCQELFNQLELDIIVVSDESENLLQSLVALKSGLFSTEAIICLYIFIEPTHFEETYTQEDCNSIALVLQEIDNKIGCPIFLFMLDSACRIENTQDWLASLSQSPIKVVQLDNLITQNKLDTNMQRLVNIPYTHEYQYELVLEAVRLLHSVIDPVIKVVVVDADNTLWQGICAEQALQDIEITEQHLALQQFLLFLEAKGILLCLVSQNIKSDVMTIFQHHPKMLLKQQHFVASKINWKPKSKNIYELAKLLNLSVASFVVIDDRIEQCQEIKTNCEGTIVFQFEPTDLVVNNIINHPVFKWMDFSSSKTKHYSAAIKRQVTQATYLSYDEFLVSLGLSLQISIAKNSDYKRISELSMRTTQFNISNARLTPAELEKMSECGYRHFVLRLSDRFGNYGLVGFISGRQVDALASIKHFCLSCRALNKGVEHQFFKEVVLRHFSAVTKVQVLFVKTQRNIPAEKFLTRYFQHEKSGEEIKYVCSYEKVSFIEFSSALNETELVGQRSEMTRLFDEQALLLLQQKRAIYQSQRGKKQKSTAIKKRCALEEVEAIWLKIGGISQVKVNDSLFALGFSSLMIARLTAALSGHYHLSLSFWQVYQNDTLQKQVSLIEVLTAAPKQRKKLLSETCRATLQQRALFALDNTMKTWAYNVPVILDLKGKINKTAFLQAVKNVISHHEIFKGYFKQSGSELALVYDHSQAVSIDEIEKINSSQESLLACCHSLAIKPFNLEQAPLYRVQYIQAAKNRAVLCFVAHHTIFDEWSERIFLAQLSSVYNNMLNPGSAAELVSTLPYRQYAAEQIAEIESSAYDDMADFWLSQMQVAAPTKIIPDVQKKSDAVTFEGHYIESKINQSLVDEVKLAAQAQNTTFYVFVLSAFAWTLSKYINQNNLIIAAPFWNRPEDAYDETVGYFTNIVLLSMQFGVDHTVSTLIDNVKQIVQSAVAFQKYPFTMLLEKMGLDLFYNDIRGPRVGFSHIIESGCDFEGLESSKLIRALDCARFGFNFEVRDAVDACFFAVSADLSYSKSFVNGFLNTIENVLSAFVKSPTASLAKIKLAEFATASLKGKVRNDSGSKHLALLLEKKFCDNPEQVVVIDQEKQLTYAELNEKSQQIAAALLEKGVEAGSLVGVCLDKSIEQVCLTVALVKISCAYVSLDPQHPKQYKISIIQRAKMRLVVTSNAHLLQFQAADIEAVAVEGLLAMKAVLFMRPKAYYSNDLLYVLYTSGSTGRPKGVQISHANFYNVYQGLKAQFNLSPAQRMLFFHAYGFDIGQWEMWASLLSGCALVLISDEHKKSPQSVLKCLIDNKVTILNQTPSAFMHLCEALEYTHVHYALPDLSLLTFVGEKLSTGLIGRFLKAVECHAKFIDLYGITEVTVYSTYKIIDQNKVGKQLHTVGKPIDNTNIVILDEVGKPLPIGAVGEICLSGDGVSKGYLHNDALTKHRFIRIDGSHELIYRSGDYGRILPSCELEVMGRQDDQVKLRGQRFDLKDIAYELKQHPDVFDAVVILQGESASQKLVAYIIPDKRHAKPLYELAKLQQEHPDLQVYQLPNDLMLVHSNPFETQTVYKEVFVDSEYLCHGVTLPDNAVVIDIGANIGLFSLRLGLLTQKVSVYSYEPLKPIYAILEKNMKIYGLDHIKYFNLGVGSSVQPLNFTYYPKASVLSTAYADENEERTLMSAYIENINTEKVQASTVDALVSAQLEKQTFLCQMTTVSDIILEHGLSHIDLLKVDAEKSELAVLEGIKSEHWSLIKQIAVEVHDVGDNVQSVQNLLSKKGYYIKNIQNHDLKTTALQMIFAFQEQPENNQAFFESRLPKWRCFDTYQSNLGSFISNKLPKIMQPSYYQCVTNFPMNNNGKLDKTVLCKQSAHLKAKNPPSSPLGALEQRILTVWKKVLQNDRITVHNNFFDVGGNSLLLMSLFEQLVGFLPEFTVTDIFTYPTVASIAARFNEEETMTQKLPESVASHCREVAIVGYAFALPETSRETLWQNIVSDRNCITTFTDEMLSTLGVPLQKQQDKHYIRNCGYVPNCQYFDAEFFDLYPVDARLTDPQHRMLMTLSWEALEHAAYVPSKFSGDIGIYCSVGTNHYLPNEDQQAMTLTSQEIFSQKDYVATRIAYKLGLTGPALNINTACSSGLVNLIKACQSLQLHEADIMLSASATLILPHRVGYLYEKGGILSPDGCCKPFSAQASGTVLGSGAIVFVLKRLTDALQDGDCIHAVIKGVAINNDGNHKVGFAAPSSHGQKRCLEKAIDMANVDLTNMVYMEAHGTGTQLGDAIEAQVLKAVYGSQLSKPQSCAVGSAKANYGHTDAASGALGVLKVMKILEERVIPLNHHCTDSVFSEENSALYTNSDAVRNFADASEEYYGAVSSFGIGGTNAHAILSTSPVNKVKNRAVALPNVLLISAKTEVALKALCEKLSSFLHEMAEQDKVDDVFLTSFCYTLQIGRADFAYRYAVVMDEWAGDTKIFSEYVVQGELFGDIGLLPTEMAQSTTQWLSGKSINWLSFYSHIKPRRMHLPTTVFQKKSYWLESIAEQDGPGANSSNSSSADKLTEHSVANSILAIFSECLGYDKVGLDDNFEALGGDSLVAISILSRLEKEFGCKITIDDIFLLRSIRQTIKKVLSVPFLRQISQYMICLRVSDSKSEPVFFVHPGNGGIFHYNTLISYLDVNRSIYGIENQIFNETFKHFETIESMATFYISEIRKVQPKGPYTLVGWSFGGSVAYDIARQLESEGEVVNKVVIFDTWASHNSLWSDEYFKWVCDRSMGGYSKDREALLLERFYKRKQMFADYKPLAIRANVILFKADEIDPEFIGVQHVSNYWGDVLGDNLSVIASGGSHLTMVAKPHVEQLAKRLGQLLTVREEVPA